MDLRGNKWHSSIKLSAAVALCLCALVHFIRHPETEHAQAALASRRSPLLPPHYHRRNSLSISIHKRVSIMHLSFCPGCFALGAALTYLHVILAEHPMACLIRLLHGLCRLRLADSHQARLQGEEESRAQWTGSW